MTMMMINDNNDVVSVCDVCQIYVDLFKSKTFPSPQDVLEVSNGSGRGGG